jgi:hypothetical protein
MARDYLQEALHKFNGGNWYSWKKQDSEGNTIPNDDRMQYQYIEITKEGATMPTEAEVNAKIEELKQAETDKETKRASAKQKLQDLGLTVDEIKEAFGI